MRYLITALLVSAFTLPANAELAAQFLVLQEASGFESNRRYAGQTVAARASELGFKQGGLITEILVDIGTEVSAGQPLARLDAASLRARLATADADITVAQAALAAAEAQVRLARNTERRMHQLRQSGHTPQQTYDEARLNLDVRAADRLVAKAQLERMVANRNLAQIALDEAVLYAPFKGVIQARHMDEGTQVLPGQPALRIVENSTIEMHVGLPTSVASGLSPAETFDVLWQGQTVAASLTGVLPEVDPVTRTQTAVLTTDVSNLPLGSVIELQLRQTVPGAGYWLPLSSLVESERGLWGAYVIGENSTAERRLVEIVHNDGERVFVRGTLAAGERVISSGVHRIVPGQQVTPVQTRQPLVIADAR